MHSMVPGTVDSNVSEKQTVSIFMAQSYFSETLVTTYESTRRHNTERRRHGCGSTKDGHSGISAHLEDNLILALH
jgi:hypothetical protein